MPSAGGESPSITMVCLLGETNDRMVVAEVAYQNRWDALFIDHKEHALSAFEHVHAQIVLVDRDAAGPEWRSIIAKFAEASPGACVILVSKVLDDYLWNEVVCNGGYEILAKPLREDEVRRTVRLARSYWSSANKVLSSPSH